MVLFGEPVVCSCAGRYHYREETPVCHDCLLVVNGTSKLIISIPPRHGF